MSQTPCVATIFEPEVWDNMSEAARRVNVDRPLTRSSVLTREKAPMKTTQCAVDDCERADVHARGLCGMHYLRQKRRGTTGPLVMPSPAQRLAAGLVRMPNGCLEWTGATDPKGYGRITADGKTVLTHRLAWGLAHPDEPMPPVVRHYVCDNPPVITSVNDRYVFVRYGSQVGSAATNPADLERVAS